MSYVVTGYLVTIAGLGGYALRTVLRARRLGRGPAAAASSRGRA